jgi:hypothetical protein
MDMPILIEVRYKSFSKLDYITGEFYIYELQDIPHPFQLLRKCDTKLNEISIRVINNKDTMTIAKQLVYDEEVTTLYQMWGDEDELPDDSEDEPQVFIEDDHEHTENCAIINIVFVNDIDKKLIEYYKQEREKGAK